MCNYFINFYHYLLILGESGIALIFGSELLNGYLAAQDNDHKVAVSLVASDSNRIKCVISLSRDQQTYQLAFLSTSTVSTMSHYITYLQNSWAPRTHVIFTTIRLSQKLDPCFRMPTQGPLKSTSGDWSIDHLWLRRFDTLPPPKKNVIANSQKREVLGKMEHPSIFRLLLRFWILFWREFNLRWWACWDASSQYIWSMELSCSTSKWKVKKKYISSRLQDVPTLPFRRYQTYL